MARKKVQRLIRPSGVQTSANGKYFYWKCNVSGLETFADEKRFKEVVSNFGGEDKLFKTYVLRPVKKYVDAGFSAEQIKKLIADNDGKLPSLDGKAKERKAELKKLKKPRKKRLGKFATGETVEQVSTETGAVEEVKLKVYPWSNNPDYFKSPPQPLDVAEVTKEACMFPNRHLDEQCRGCPVYDRCTCPVKLGEADWNAPRRNAQPKVKQIDVWAE